jgi:hypothetical protein
MWVLPFAAGVVSGVFSSLLLRQWLGRPKPNLLAWSLALTMFAVASFAAAAGMLFEWTEGWYRLYYLLGAIVNVPVLALGTIYLLAPPRVARVGAWLVLIASLIAVAMVYSSELRPGVARAFSTDGIPSGYDVMPQGVRLLARYYSFAGFFVVVGGAVWSALRLRRARDKHLGRLVAANVLIATGTVVVAVGSGFAFYGQGWPFAVGLTTGVTLMFWGFLKTRKQIVEQEQR